LKLTHTLDYEGTANATVVYDGSSVEAMGAAIEAYIPTAISAQRAKYVRRWWIKAQVQTENGLEPELRYIGDVGMDLWKVTQQIGS